MNFFKKEETKTESKPMPFKSFETKKTKGQTFGRPKLKKCGKEFDVYDWIQSGREDTEIYATLEKYGCLDRMETDFEQIFGDLSEIKDLRGIIEQSEKAEELWNRLPMELRNQFQNNKALFMEQGEEFVKNKINEIKKEQEPTTGADVETKKEETNA